ncbi:MAG: transporter permease [Dehalococcoidia bacterium]|nr:transporter permease [Dehalococcoidia bacterium]
MARESSPSAALAGQLRRRRRRIPFWLEPYHTLVTKKHLSTFGMVVLLLMLLAAAFADVVSPYSPVAMDLTIKLDPPSVDHIFGTDQFGRDMLSRMIYGARTSLYVGFGVVIISTLLGVSMGILSGYLGGKFDLIYQRFVDAIQAIPSLVLLLTIVSVIGPGLVNIILALSFRQSIGESRVVRGAVIGIRGSQYMEAAKVIGAGLPRILLRYVLPNVMAPITILASLALGGAILSEATLSFLGFGVPPPLPTWGAMLSDEARRYMIQAPWMAIVPGLALSIVIYSINMFGDGLRDVLDPRLRGSK